MRVAFLMSRFPHLSETFILREMDMVKKLGIEVSLYPLVLQKQVVMHSNAKKWLESKDLYRTGFGSIFRKNISCLIKNPVGYIHTFFLMLVGNLLNPKFLIRGVYLFPSAVAMADVMEKRGINHIHAHYATHPALAAWIIHRLTNIPFSVTVHAHDIFVQQTMLKEKLKSAAFIRAISKYNRDFLIKKLGHDFSKKIVVIHTGIDPALYHRQIKKSGHVFRILNIGSLQLYKGQPYLIKACGILKNKGISFECVIIGQGKLKELLQEQIGKHGLHGQVILAGGKTEEEINLMLPEFDCYVQPSIITSSGKMEGIPVAIMEALACEIPVIATSISGIPELVEENRTGFLIPPEDSIALANTIEMIMKHPGQAKKLAVMGRKKVKEEFNLEKNARELISMFR
jgi:colanic acid/amylovoran biosynthesis glycosyltransferase